MSGLQLCTFFVGDAFFGVDVARVQEVIRYQEMTRVPMASHVVSGLINLRGQIVTALDMRARLGMPPRTGDDLPMNVVLRTDDGVVSLMVDEIGDVIDVDEADWERTPETTSTYVRDLVSGVFKLTHRRLLLVLDTERAIALDPPGRTRTGS